MIEICFLDNIENPSDIKMIDLSLQSGLFKMHCKWIHELKSKKFLIEASVKNLYNYFLMKISQSMIGFIKDKKGQLKEQSAI